MEHLRQEVDSGLLYRIFILQFGDHLPRNITKAVKMLEQIAGKGSAVGQQVVKQ